MLEPGNLLANDADECVFGVCSPLSLELRPNVLGLPMAVIVTNFVFGIFWVLGVWQDMDASNIELLGPP